MNHYSIALFLHIVGALGLFAALGLEWVGLRQMRRATTAEQVREWLRIANGTGRMGMLSMLTLLISGILMMVSVWGAVAWVIVTLATLVLLAVFVAVFSGRRMAAIGRDITDAHGPLAVSFREVLNHPSLWIVMQTRVAILLGIVFLMTVKPDLSGSLLTIGVAAVVSLAAAVTTLGSVRTQQEPAA